MFQRKSWKVFLFPAGKWFLWENFVMFNSVPGNSSLSVFCCFSYSFSWVCLNCGSLNVRSGFPFSVMVWRLPLLSSPWLSIWLVPPLSFLTTYLHNQSIMIWGLPQNPASGVWQTGLATWTSPKPHASNRKSLAASVRSLPEIPVSQFPPTIFFFFPLRESLEEMLSCLSLAQVGF